MSSMAAARRARVEQGHRRLVDVHDTAVQDERLCGSYSGFSATSTCPVALTRVERGYARSRAR